MPTQTDVQKLIQGLAPGSVNNGNPNTIYNTPATVANMAPVDPHLATVPPSQLTLPPVTPSSQLGAWVAPHAPQAINLPQWKIIQPTAGSGTSTTPPPATTPPGETQTPLNLGAGFKGNTWYPSELKGIFNENSLLHNPFNADDPEIQARYGLNSVPEQVRAALTPTSNGTVDQSSVDNVLTNMMPKTSNGSIDWLEALDRLTEIFPLLNGVNWHDADTGKINIASSAIQVVANALGLGPIIKFFTNVLGKARTQTDGKSHGVGNACVTVDSRIFGLGRAGNVKEGDTIRIIDPTTFEMSEALVTYAEPKLQPTVRITTKDGFSLECSRSAPISDETGEPVLAEHLLGISIPVSRFGVIDFEVVMKVEDMGEQMVQHITCDNNYFLAGEEDGAYTLHHNAKKPPTFGNMDAKLWSDLGSSLSGWGSELDFGGGNGTATVGTPTQIR